MELTSKKIFCLVPPELLAKSIKFAMAEHGLSEDEVADLKEAFSMYDVDGGGTSTLYTQRGCSLFAPERYCTYTCP